MSNTKSKDALVVAATYGSSFDANIGLTKLRDADIPCILNNQIWAGVWGVPTAQYDTIRLMVFERDLDRAVAILGDVSE